MATKKKDTVRAEVEVKIDTTQPAVVTAPATEVKKETKESNGIHPASLVCVRFIKDTNVGIKKGEKREMSRETAEILISNGVAEMV